MADDPLLIKPGDIVKLDSKLLKPTHGGQRTWSHFAVALFYYDLHTGRVPVAITSGVAFHFVCTSSITKARPFDPTRQVRIPEAPTHGLHGASAACVDFSPVVDVTIEDGRLVLDGVERLILASGQAWRLESTSTLQAIHLLYNKYWRQVAEDSSTSR